MITTTIESQVSFKRGATNNFFKVFFMNEEIGEVKRTTLAGKRAWEIEGHIKPTREEAVIDYLFNQKDEEELQSVPDPTFGDYDPAGMTFPNGDEVLGFWFIEEGVKYHIAIDKEGREYETSDQPIRKEVAN